MRLSRLGALTWGASVVALVLRLPHAALQVDGLSSPSFPTVLTSALELLLLAVAGWAAVALGGCMLGGASARAASRLVPRAARSALLAGVATALTIGGAHAGADGPAPHHGATVTLDGLTLPDRPVSHSPETTHADPTDADPTTSEPSTAGPSTAAPPSDGDVVLVAPGDTLWAIAAQALDPRASDADVAHAVQRWHDANRRVIGDDPDLVRPGQRLVAPQDLA